MTLFFFFNLPDTPELPQQGGMILPDGTDLRQVTVLSKAEWDRIERELNRRQIEEERVRRIRKEHEEQKQKSRELVKSWGNTLHVRLIFMYLCQKGEGVNKLGTCIVSYIGISLPLLLPICKCVCVWGGGGGGEAQNVNWCCMVICVFL